MAFPMFLLAVPIRIKCGAEWETAALAPGNVSLIGDLMNLQYSSSLIYIYRLLLNAYPTAYRVQFEDEMYDTFFEGAQEAEATDNLTPFLLREFRDIPRSLIKAY